MYLGVYMYIYLFQDNSASTQVYAYMCVGVFLHVYECVVHHRVFVLVPFLCTNAGGRGSTWLPGVL